MYNLKNEVKDTNASALNKVVEMKDEFIENLNEPIIITSNNTEKNIHETKSAALEIKDEFIKNLNEPIISDKEKTEIKEFLHPRHYVNDTNDTDNSNVSLSPQDKNKDVLIYKGKIDNIQN